MLCSSRIRHLVVSIALMTNVTALAAPCPGPSQKVAEKAKDNEYDALKVLEEGFPGSVKLREKRRLLEFCPDNTCDGFVASSDVSFPTLKDFAYLYVYYFSQYLVDLPEWRQHEDAKSAAQRVLSRPAYQNCLRDTNLETARCVLLDLSRNGRIKLLFIRYDEGQRNVVIEDIKKELTRKNP